MTDTPTTQPNAQPAATTPTAADPNAIPTGADADAAIAAAKAAQLADQMQQPAAAPTGDIATALSQTAPSTEPAATTTPTDTQPTATQAAPTEGALTIGEPSEAGTPAEVTPVDMNDPKARALVSAPYYDTLASGKSLSPEQISTAAKQFGVSEEVVSEFAVAKTAQLIAEGVITQPVAPASTAATTPAGGEPAPTAVATEGSSALDIARTYEAIGGSQNWADFSGWAAQNLSAAEQAAFNGGTSAERAKLAEVYAPRFKATLEAATTGGATTVPVRDAATEATPAPSASAPVAVQPFASDAEVTQAMNDPRYQTDPVYRSGVIARLAVTAATN